MTDRELLELAAKAIGMETTLLPSLSDPGRQNKRPWMVEDSEWNPLTDDGDALRLAVKLEASIEQGYGKAFCSIASGEKPSILYGEADECYSGNGGCMFAATRRAITRAAAEIGRAMQ